MMPRSSQHGHRLEFADTVSETMLVSVIRSKVQGFTR
jgi:hypothetical protein